MDSEQMSNKELKVEIPSGSEMFISGRTDFHAAAAVSTHPGGHGSASGLSRQGSMTKTNCLCSPTTHAGSFRCRLHRVPNLERTKSIDSKSASIHDSTASKPNPDNI